MLHVLKLLSLTAGTAAVIHTANLMLTAAEVMNAWTGAGIVASG